MTEEVMIDRLRKMTGECNQGALLAALDAAAEAILNKCYPFDAEQDEVPTRYRNRQVEIAAYLLNKRGAEGETAHSENGVARTYENAGVPDSMLAGIVPFASVL